MIIFPLVNILYMQTMIEFVKVNTDQVSLAFCFCVSKGTRDLAGSVSSQDS